MRDITKSGAIKDQILIRLSIIQHTVLINIVHQTKNPPYIHVVLYRPPQYHQVYTKSSSWWGVLDTTLCDQVCQVW